MARRMGRRLSLLLVVVALPFALWAVLPLGSSGQSSDSLQRQDRPQARADRPEEGPRARPDHRGQRLHAARSAPCSPTSRCSRPSRSASRPTSRPSAPSSPRSRRTCGASACASRGCASGWPRRGWSSPTGWSRSTRRTRRTWSRSCSRPTASPTCSSGPSSSQRTSAQDARIIGRVREAKAESTATAARLDRLEKRAEKLAAAIEAEVAQVAAVKGELVDRRDSYATARAGKAQLLANTRASRHELEDHVDALEREQSAVLARLRGRQRRRGPDPAGLGQPDLARQRLDLVALRHALGAPARGHRHADAGGHARCARRTAARSRSPAGSAATATTPASSTAARSPPATATSRASPSRSASRSARARSSATRATRATAPARTCTSRCG